MHFCCTLFFRRGTVASPIFDPKWRSSDLTSNAQITLKQTSVSSLKFECGFKPVPSNLNNFPSGELSFWKKNTVSQWVVKHSKSQWVYAQILGKGQSSGYKKYYSSWALFTLWLNSGLLLLPALLYADKMQFVNNFLDLATQRWGRVKEQAKKVTWSLTWLQQNIPARWSIHLEYLSSSHMSNSRCHFIWPAFKPSWLSSDKAAFHYRVQWLQIYDLLFIHQLFQHIKYYRRCC